MSDKVAILTYLSLQNIPVTMKMLKETIPFSVSERTVRRWLNEAQKEGKVIIQGQRRTTTYTSTTVGKGNTPFKFLEGKSKSLQEQILKSLRDFWTHNSTAIEGNTLTLGDTQFILDEGLTVSGKPIKEHQEIIGHASAIELVYRMLETGVTEQSFFDLHKAIQSEVIHDIDKPYGAWKVEVNGTRVLGIDNTPIYLEYAHPTHVEFLMSEVITLINEKNHFKTSQEAIKVYTMIHAAVAHIHPFWDGNGRIARLIANIPLLKAGLPPIVIPNERRREYIQLLASYEMKMGKLDKKSGALPEVGLLYDFEMFCTQCYEETLNIISMS
jgi:Fic family protein